jgi:hypothetical protein
VLQWKGKWGMAKAVYITFVITIFVMALVGIATLKDDSAFVMAFQPEAVAAMHADNNALTLALAQEQTRQLQLDIEDRADSRMNTSRNILIIGILSIALVVSAIALFILWRAVRGAKQQEHYHYFPGTPGFEQHLIEDGGHIREDGVPVDKTGRPVKLLTINQE